MDVNNYLLHIKHSNNLIYRENQGKSGRKKVTKELDLSNFEDGNYKDTDISVNSIRRMKRAINNLILISPRKYIYNPVTNKEQPFRLNFITLTLSAPQEHSDKIITSKILSPFLKEMQRKNLIGSYVWKAEKQENYNIHYHITSNKFIHYSELRDIWNRHQNNLGYIDKFKNKHGHNNPNSTDIHSTKNIKDLEAYLIKYITKEVDKKELIVKSKKWDCSTNLKRKEQPVIEIDFEIGEVINELKEIRNDNFLYFDYFTILKNDSKVKKELFKLKSVRSCFDLFVKKINASNKEYEKIKNTKFEYILDKKNDMKSVLASEREVFPLKIRYIQEVNGYKIPRYKIVKDSRDFYLLKKYLDKFGYLYEVINI